jgi:preprotein translocase subunit SecB
MDKTKQPGILINAILLADSVFHRAHEIPKNLKFKLNFAINNIIDKSNLVTELTVRVNTKEDPVYLIIKYVGIFSGMPDSNMNLEEFSQISAPAMLLPYIREEIHNRLLKANVFNIGILPPINLQALLKESKKKTSETIKNKS